MQIFMTTAINKFYLYGFKCMCVFVCAIAELYYYKHTFIYSQHAILETLSNRLEELLVVGSLPNVGQENVFELDKKKKNRRRRKKKRRKWQTIKHTFRTEYLALTFLYVFQISHIKICQHPKTVVTWYSSCCWYFVLLFKFCFAKIYIRTYFLSFDMCCACKKHPSMFSYFFKPKFSISCSMTCLPACLCGCLLNSQLRLFKVMFYL